MLMNDQTKQQFAKKPSRLKGMLDKIQINKRNDILQILDKTFYQEMQNLPLSDTATPRKISNKRLMLKEKKVQEEFQRNQINIAKLRVMEMDDQNCHMSPQKENTNKIRGNFKLCMKKDLKMKFKVFAFANEPLSYHIHKNRQLFTKILQKPKEDSYTSAKRIISNYNSVFQTPRISRSNPRQTSERMGKTFYLRNRENNDDLLDVFETQQSTDQKLSTSLNFSRNIFHLKSKQKQQNIGKTQRQTKNVRQSIKNILDQIKEEQSDIQQNLRYIERQQNLLSHKEDQFLRISDQFQDLNVINEKCLKQAISYRMESEREEKNEADEVAHLYKSAILDPSKKIEDRLALRRRYAKR